MTQSPPVVEPSFVRALLDGRVDFGSLLPYPSLSEDQLKAADGLLHRKKRQVIPGTGADRLRDWDLLVRPVAWPASLLARVIQQTGAVDPSVALCAIAHLALGVRLVREFGTEAQQRSIDETPGALLAFALTEASPGSDVSRVQTVAEPVEGGGYLLTGTKHWVTNAAWATHFIVVARTAPARGANKPKLTAFLVKAGPGITLTRVNTDVLPDSGVSDVAFDCVPLEASDVLGTVGKGFRVVMAGLSEARLLVGAAVLGGCIRAYNDTLARVVERRAFGRAVAQFPSVQDRISGMLSEILAMESLVHGVAGLAAGGSSLDPVERGLVRLAVSRGAGRVLDAARELHGAAAYAGDVSTARLWADTRALTLLDGSDLALESYIMLEGTRELRHRAAPPTPAAPPPKTKGVASFLGLGPKTRSVEPAPAFVALHPGLSPAALQALAARLGKSVDEAVSRYGVDWVEKQHAQSRLATATSDLAAWMALAARVQTELESSGAIGGRRMIDVAEVWVHSARARIAQELDALSVNDDAQRDAVAGRAYSDQVYPFDVF